MRSLGEKTLTGNIDTLTRGRTCAYVWFNANRKDIAAFEDNFKTDLLAFEAALDRLKAMKPKEWTLLNVCELGTRLLNEIRAFDALVLGLARRKANVTELERESMKHEVRAKQDKSWALNKLAKPWLETGSTHKLPSVLRDIGAF